MDLQDNLKLFLIQACKPSFLNEEFIAFHHKKLIDHQKSFLKKNESKTGTELHFYIYDNTQRILILDKNITFSGFSGSIFMTTIWHTGTVYILTGLRKKYTIKFQHCFPEALKQAKENDWIITTYRNPLRVAASWANRDKIRHASMYKGWFTQWKTYRELLLLKPTIFEAALGRYQQGERFGPTPLNQSRDRLGLHAALNRNDMDYYYSHIPKEMIDFANDQISDMIYP